MSITIKRLSEISGYSTATISRVISGAENVKPETREAIEKLLMEYNYRTNVMELRQRRTGAKQVMILVGDLDNWYYMEIIRTMNRQILKDGYIPVIMYTDNLLEQEEDLVRMALLENMAGIVFLNVRGDEKLKEILEKNDCPVVFLNRGIRRASFDSVCNDNYHGGFQATEYLIRHGHRKIGHVMGSIYSSTAQERKRGYEDAMREYGLTVTKNSILMGNQHYETSYQCGEKIIRAGLDFTALFCCSYQVAEGVLDSFADYGVKVPEDISVLCFDDTPGMARRGITTLCADPEKMGTTAWDLLKNRIHGTTTESSMISLQTRLRERTSVRDIR